VAPQRTAAMQKLFRKRKNCDRPRHPAINPEYTPVAGHEIVFPAVSQASQPTPQGYQTLAQASQERPGEPFRSQGDELARKSDYMSALVMYNAALGSAPNRLSLLLSRSMAHSMLEPPNLDLALNDADHVIQLNPNWWQGWLQRGQVLLRKGDLQGAKEALTNATTFAQGFDIITAQRALDDMRACQAPPSSHPQLIGRFYDSEK
jgi:tetratricopeptide (TPR) repeat protein